MAAVHNNTSSGYEYELPWNTSRFRYIFLFCHENSKKGTKGKLVFAETHTRLSGLVSVWTWPETVLANSLCRNDSGCCELSSCKMVLRIMRWTGSSIVWSQHHDRMDVILESSRLRLWRPIRARRRQRRPIRAQQRRRQHRTNRTECIRRHNIELLTLSHHNTTCTASPHHRTSSRH